MSKLRQITISVSLLLVSALLFAFLTTISTTGKPHIELSSGWKSMCDAKTCVCYGFTVQQFIGFPFAVQRSSEKACGYEDNRVATVLDGISAIAVVGILTAAVVGCVRYKRREQADDSQEGSMQ